MEGQEHTDTPAAWLIRAGRHGEREDFNIEHGIASMGWDDLPDLAGTSSREDMTAMIRKAMPEASVSRIAAHAGQLWTMRARVRPGDLVVLPRKKTSQIALGIVTREYRYQNDPDPKLRHAVSVDWKRTDVPRTAVRQDLLYSLGSARTVCSIQRNDGAWRLQQLLLTGHDPGARVGPSGEATGSAVHAADIADDTADNDEDATDSSESGFDLERLGMDQIQAFVAEEFAGHELSRLVAEVLKAEGFFTEESPPGPDGGIDVFAGRGPLGLDSPRLVVQVKSSPSPVDVKIVRELHGVLTTHGAEQALLVAWGGVNNAARRELRNQFFRVRVWDADHLLKAVLRNYDRLSEDLRADLPLKRIWSLVEE